MKQKELTPYNLFIALSLTGILSFFCFALVRGAYAFDWISIGNQGGLHFIDYFNHVLFAGYPDRIYEIAPAQWGNFPPFAYLLYRFVYLIAAPQGTVPSDTIELINENYYMPLFLYYSLVVILILTYAVRLWDHKGKYLRTEVCLLFSVPFFAGGVERGNSIILVMAFMLIALKWRDSTSKLKRESAMLLIAASAGFKIYPAVLGFLYLKEHRFKEAIRLFLYGVAVIFLPFIVFGGRNAFNYWVAQIMATSAVTNHLGRMEYIGGIVHTLNYLLTGASETILTSILSLVFMLVMFFLAFSSSSKVRTVFFLCCIMAFFPVNSHRYTLCYFSLPLLMLLYEQGDNPEPGTMIWAEIVGFSCIFSIPTIWGIMTGFKLKISEISYYTTHVEFWIYLSAYLLMIIFIAQEIMEIKNKNYNPDLKKQVCMTR